MASVASPAGTMIQTARGAGNPATSSPTLKAPSAPSVMISRVFSGVRLKATTSWPSRTSRRTMFAPIRPRPMKPMRIGSLLVWSARSDRALRLTVGRWLRESLAKRPFERRKTGVDVGAEVDAEHRQVVRLERLEVTEGLGIHQLPEAERSPRDLDIDRVVGRELEEPADRRAALVELARGVQEARAEPARRRATGRVAEEPTHPVHRLGPGRGRRDERLEREVRVRVRPRHVASQLAGAGAVAASRAERPVADEDEAVALGEDCGGRERTGPLELREDALRVLLRFGDVRLVERVDLEAEARDRGGDLPAHELGGEVDGVR